jgi:trans-aconitate methyltransferase
MSAPGPPLVLDAWARIYDAPLVQRLTYRPVHDAVASELIVRRPRRVVDVGCGTGLLTTRLREALPGARVAGVDFSGGMLRQAAGRAPGAAWVCGDALRLPLGSERIDAIVSTEAFHWFPDQAAALAEMRRVLVPGGAVLVALVNVRRTTSSRRDRARVARPRPTARMAHPRAHARAFAGAGLTVVAQRRIFASRPASAAAGPDDRRAREVSATVDAARSPSA